MKPRSAADPRRRRVQRLAFGVLGAGLVILVLAGIAFRDLLLESWYLHRLDAADEDAVAAAVLGLGEVGSIRSVPRLLELAEADSSLLEESVRALGRICPRLGRSARSPVLERLVDYVRDELPPAFEVLLELAPDAPDLFPIAFRVLEATPRPPAPTQVSFLNQIRIWNSTSGEPAVSFSSRCASLVVAGWPESRAATTAFLAKKRLEHAVVFVRDLQIRFRADLSPANPEIVSEILRHFAREHPEPEIRALCLAHAVTVSRSGEAEIDFAFLREAFRTDESLLVRRALVRLACLIGNQPENLDLSGLLLETRQAPLLGDIVHAMTILAADSSQVRGVELFAEVECDWIGPGNRKTTARAWSPSDVDAAAALLESRREPELRDALSTALAEPWRSASETRLATAGDYTVHEWGVWKEVSSTIVPRPVRGRLAPAGPTLADLPPFVHRSQISAGALGEARRDPDSPIVIHEVLKPVVFFYASRPQVVFLQVGFHRGRPWTYFPQPTDYTLEAIESGSPGRRAAGGRPLRVVDGVVSVGDRELPERELPDEIVYALPGGLSSVPPPWLLATSGGLTPEARAELAERYRIAPWRRPRSPFVTPYIASGGAAAIVNPRFTVAAVGLEWSGLRVGFAPELEAPRPEAERGSWWSFLREVPSNPVAIRGESEGFLFYDGAVPLEPPLRASWIDPDRLLAIRVRAYSDVDSTDPWRTSASGTSSMTIPACFVVHVGADASIRGTVLHSLAPVSLPRRIAIGNPDSDAVEKLEVEGSELREQFEAALQEQGLTPEEARSLTRTWEAEFFRSPGTRVLTLIPRRLYDLLLPLTIRPRPRELVRVGVVWKELE